MNRPTLLIVLLLAAATGCASASHTNSSQVSTTPSKASTPVSAAAASIANGRLIYQTGRDSNGVQIVAQHRPLYPSCAACHGISGSGGIQIAGGVKSADLRYKAPVSSQSKPYTLALLERAISTGIDDDGNPINQVMPHWKLSRRDLHDVAYYVLTKLK